MGRLAEATVFLEGGQWKARLTLPDGAERVIALPHCATAEEACARAADLVANEEKELTAKLVEVVAEAAAKGSTRAARVLRRAGFKPKKGGK